MVLGFAKYSKKSDETQVRYRCQSKVFVFVICCCFDKLRVCGRSPFYFRLQLLVTYDHAVKEMRGGWSEVGERSVRGKQSCCS